MIVLVICACFLEKSADVAARAMAGTEKSLAVLASIGSVKKRKKDLRVVGTTWQGKGRSTLDGGGAGA